MENEKIVIAGGSGFLGKMLARWFSERGKQVVILARRKMMMEGANVIHWDGETLDDWSQELEGSKALINLAGRSVNCRYHAKNRALMMNSRVNSTKIIAEAINRCEQPPEVWLNMSTATIYKHTFGNPHDESGEIGSHQDAKDAFSIEVANKWEKTFQQAVVPPSTRKVTLRLAMVFDDVPKTVYKILTRLVRLGLGGKMGSGKQFVSWIHATDFCRSVDWLIDHQVSEGIYNLAAPSPVTNQEMMGLLRKKLGVKIGLPATEWMLEIGTFLLRSESELVIKSRRVTPQRLLEEGFEFHYPKMEEAIDDLEGNLKPALNKELVPY